MTTPSPSPSPPAPRGENYAAPLRTWPADRLPLPAVSVETRCARCEQPWRIHRSMSGYRLRCSCGGWLAVPYQEAEIEKERRRLAPRTTTPQISAQGSNRASTPAPPREPKELVAAEVREEPPGSASTRIDLAAIPASPTARDIDRGILATIAVGGALLGPPLLAALTYGFDRAVDFLPFTSLISGTLVLVVGSLTGQMGSEGLRGARISHYFTATVLAAAGVVLAQAWVEWAGGGAVNPLVDIVEQLGLPMALFTLALCPAIFEELGFRGIIQGRLIGLLGGVGGILVTAILFTVAHGISLASPIHLLLGLILGFLRLRTGSLYPGMLLHGLYNGALIVLAAS